MTEASLVTAFQPAVRMQPRTPPKPPLVERVKQWPCTRARVEGLFMGIVLGAGVAAQILVNVPR